MKNLSRIGVVLLVIAVLAGAWLQPLDDPAKQRVDDGLQRALVTYGSARVLHAVVSVVQGTEISATPAGVGAGR
jgi:heme A synthase